MEKYENDYHNITNERLAEMLENEAGNQAFIANCTPAAREIIEKRIQLLDEAARRLRFIAKTPIGNQFNHEQFNI